MIFCWWAFHFFHNCSFFINIFYSNVMIVFVFLWKEIYFQHFINIFFSFFGIYYTDLGTDLQYLMEKTKVIETHASDKKNCFCLKRRSIFLFKKKTEKCQHLTDFDWYTIKTPSSDVIYRQVSANKWKTCIKSIILKLA